MTTRDWNAQASDRIYGSTCVDERWGTIIAGKDSGGVYRVRWDDTPGVVNMITDVDILRLHRGGGAIVNGRALTYSCPECHDKGEVLFCTEPDDVYVACECRTSGE